MGTGFRCRSTASSPGRTTAPIGPWARGKWLFARYFGGDTEYTVPSGKITLKVSRASADLLGETHERTGALVVGLRHFDLARGWGGRHPMMDLPVLVVTHSVSREWVYEGSPFTFVTDGVEEAAERARAVAGDKDVGVGGANVA